VYCMEWEKVVDSWFVFRMWNNFFGKM